MSTHSRLSPSSAHRWANCPGSPLGGDSPPSKFSAEGTAAHTLAETCLRTGRNPPDWHSLSWSADGFRGEFNASDLAAVQAYINQVRREPGIALYEVRLDTSNILEESNQGGTGDTVILNMDTRIITVIDLKFGRGVRVAAKDNEQLMLYLLAAMLQFDYLCEWLHGRVMISQPRMNNFDEHTYTRAEMSEFGSRMYFAARATRHRDAPRVPGDWCRWCPAKGDCPARANQVLNSFPIVELPV